MMSCPPDIPAWKIEEDGVYSRPLDTLETFFKLIDGSGSAIHRQHWAVCLALRLIFPSSVSNPVPYLREAWRRTAELHPSLTASVINSTPSGALATKSSWRVDTKELDEWSLRTFFPQSGTVKDHGLDISQEVYNVATSSNDLFGKTLATANATCCWTSTTQEIFIRASHLLLDGTGMLMLGHSFMKTLASVLMESRTCGITACTGFRDERKLAFHAGLDNLVGAYLDDSSTPKPVISAVDGLISDAIRAVPTIGLPTSPGCETAIPGDSGRLAVSIDATATAAVIAKCKALGMSVSAAMHSALISVAANYPQHALSRNYGSFVPVDMRRRSPKPYNGFEYAVGCCCSGLPLTVMDVIGSDGTRNKSFGDIAEVAKAVYSANLANVAVDDEGKSKSLLDILAPYIRRTTKLFSTPPPPELPPAQQPDLSSLGIIESYIQRSYGRASSPSGEDDGEKQAENSVQVQDFWLATQILTRSVQCHVWTFRDELHLQICFNVQFYEQAFVRNFADEVIKELLAGLDLSLYSRSAR